MNHSLSQKVRAKHFAAESLQKISTLSLIKVLPVLIKKVYLPIVGKLSILDAHRGFDCGSATVIVKLLFLDSIPIEYLWVFKEMV